MPRSQQATFTTGHVHNRPRSQQTTFTTDNVHKKTVYNRPVDCRQWS